MVFTGGIRSRPSEKLDLNDHIHPNKDFSRVLTWLARQIMIILHRKWMHITNQRAGAVYGEHPTVIFIKVVRRVVFYPPTSKIGQICAMRAKFNEAMNDVTAQYGFNIMNIMGCNNEHDFDMFGKLSESGKRAFWTQVDQLVEQFDVKKIQLLPKMQNMGTGQSKPQLRRKLPTPPLPSDNSFY